MKHVTPTTKKTPPKVHMGSGVLPPRIAKALPKVGMGSGVAPPRISKHIRLGSK